MNSIRILFAFVLFMAPTPAFAWMIQLPQTGQTTCYDANGTVITCSGTGQDGELQMGIAWLNPRFKDRGDQTMEDKLTGLIWAKDGNVMKTRHPNYDTYGTAGDGVVSWQLALDYIKKLNTESYLGYNDWRLPNIIELESLVSAGQSLQYRWLNSQGFFNVQPNHYWSSSTYFTLYAWVIQMYDGLVTNFNKSYGKYVWPVRSEQSGVSGFSIISLPKTGQTTCYDATDRAITCSGTGQDGDLQMGMAWPNPRLNDRGDQTMEDKLTGLVWAKDGNVMKTQHPDYDTYGTAGDGVVSWQPALDYIKKLNTESYLGYNDWRLPNIVELKSLVHIGQLNSADWLNSQGFFNVQPNHYWSSSTYYNGKDHAWFVDMFGSYIYDDTKSLYDGYIWPVRGSFASLVISLSGSGSVTSIPTGIACGLTCWKVYDVDTDVILTAAASIGSAFAGWSGSGCTGTEICNIRVDGAKAVTATFIDVYGDINGDGTANLLDAILSLQISARMTASGHTTGIAADVNADRRIGLPEVIYILQRVAEMR